MNVYIVLKIQTERIIKIVLVLGSSITSICSRDERNLAHTNLKIINLSEETNLGCE